jgi:hypothetical protein
MDFAKVDFDLLCRLCDYCSSLYGVLSLGIRIGVGFGGADFVQTAWRYNVEFSATDSMTVSATERVVKVEPSTDVE